MKTAIKILRGTITSLLFLLLTFAIIVEFIFMSLQLNTQNLPSLIDREMLIENVLGEQIEDDSTKEVAIDFLNDYINYIFHKRSFPSLQTVNFSKIDDENLPNAKETISQLSETINLSYEEVVTIRDANNILSNGAIFLLINIGVFLVYIVICIVMGSFKNGTKLLSLSLILSSIIILASKSFILSKLALKFSEEAFIFISHILNPFLLSKITNQATIYLATGFILFSLILLYEKFIKRKS